jgi:fructose-1,6-bisphosphatase/inositol monophosphatase family enzyme
VDADRDAATCRRFAVDRFPSVLLLETDGSERFRVTGSTAAGLADAMAGLLDATTARGRMAAAPHDTAR